MLSMMEKSVTKQPTSGPEKGQKRYKKEADTAHAVSARLHVPGKCIRAPFDDVLRTVEGQPLVLRDPFLRPSVAEVAPHNVAVRIFENPLGDQTLPLAARQVWPAAPHRLASFVIHDRDIALVANFEIQRLCNISDLDVVRAVLQNPLDLDLLTVYDHLCLCYHLIHLL